MNKVKIFKDCQEVLRQIVQNPDTRIYIFPGYYVSINKDATEKNQPKIISFATELNTIVEMQYGVGRGITQVNYTRAEIERMLDGYIPKDLVLAFLAAGSHLGLWEIRPTPIESMMTTRDRLLWSMDSGQYLPYIVITAKGRSVIRP